MVKKSITIQTSPKVQLKLHLLLKFHCIQVKNGNYQCNLHDKIHPLLKFLLYTYLNNGYSFEEGNFDRSI